MRHLFLFLLLAPLCCWAQKAPVDTVYRQSPILKLSYLSLLDPLSSIQFAYEYPVMNRVSLQHEAGYITQLLLWNENVRNRSGIRLRNEIRLYLTAEGSKLNNFYLAPELMFLYYADKRTGTFGKGCDGMGDCAYFQYEEYNYSKQVLAWHLKAGFQETIFERFIFDFYAGAGTRYVHVVERNKPPFDTRFNGSLTKGAGYYTLPSLSFGFKFGFLLFEQKKKLEAEPDYYRMD